MTEENKRGRGRPPVEYTEEFENQLVERITAGNPVKTACDQLGISTFTFYQWQRENPKFAQKVQSARAERLNFLKNLSIKWASPLEEPVLAPDGSVERDNRGRPLMITKHRGDATIPLKLMTLLCPEVQNRHQGALSVDTQDHYLMDKLRGAIRTLTDEGAGDGREQIRIMRSVLREIGESMVEAAEMNDDGMPAVSRFLELVEKTHAVEDKTRNTDIRSEEYMRREDFLHLMTQFADIMTSGIKQWVPEEKQPEALHSFRYEMQSINLHGDKVLDVVREAKEEAAGTEGTEWEEADGTKLDEMLDAMTDDARRLVSGELGTSSDSSSGDSSEDESGNEENN